MFTAFFYLLRARGLAVSFNEWMSLIKALDMGLAKSSLTEFYYLCRAILVKSEADFDRFDGAFLEFFREVPFIEELPKELLEWLENPSEKPENPLDWERAMKNSGLTMEEIQKMFAERLKEQKEEHNGGSYWIGTGGVSVFGNGGYSPKGIRVGGVSHYKTAFEVAGERKFRDFRTDNTLDVRQFQMAFRHLRQFSSRIDTEKTEFDVDGTIEETCNHGGNLQIVYDKPRKNTVKVMLLMDCGGSMEYYTTLCSALFQAVSKSNHFKDLQIFYFHNCPRSRIYTAPTLQSCSAINTEWIFQNISSEYKVIFVGDALMDMWELMEGGFYSHSSSLSGFDWLKRFQKKYTHTVWLNPAQPPTYGGYWGKSYYVIENEFDMYPLTLEALQKALKKLMAAR